MISLVVMISKYKGMVFLCGLEFAKGFLHDNGNLKRVAWGLHVGTGCGRTSIKYKFAFSLPLNFFYLLLFIFYFKEVYFIF